MIGMQSAIGDVAATRFAVAFYDAVFAGTDFRTAFDLGCSALDLNKLPERDAPVFLSSPHLEQKPLVYTAHVPEVERILHAFVNTPFLQRSPLITSGDAASLLLKRHYGGRVHIPVDQVRVRSMERIDGERWLVEAELTAGNTTQSHQYYLRIRGREVLVEWEATVGLWSVPLKTYLALGHPTELVARVVAGLDHYYNFWTTGLEYALQSVLLRTKDRDYLYGYVQRKTPVYDELIAILGDGNSHMVTLALKSAGDPRDMPLILPRSINR